MPSTVNFSSVLYSNPLSNATQRVRCTWRATKLNFKSRCSSSTWRSSSSFLSFGPISVRKPLPVAKSSASTSSNEVEYEKKNNSSSSFTSIEPTASSPSNISKAVSAVAGKEKDIEFNLPWAVALAGAAFEAYADVDVPALVQKCSGGVEITYTNQEFLRDKMAGLLRISLEEICLTPLVEEENLEEDNGKDKKEKEKDISSYFCKLSIDDSCLELQLPSPSEKGDSGKSSSSGNSGYLFVKNLEKDRLAVRVVGEKKGEDAGAASLVASEFVEALREKKIKVTSEENQKQETQEKKVEISLNLHDKELEVVGFVRLKLDYKPFSDVFVASEASQGELNLIGSPGPALMSDAWRGLTSQVLEASAAAFDPVAFIENHDTDTQVWIFINKPLKQLVVSFRGTVQDSWRDLLTDISMTPISLETRHMSESPRHAPLAKLSAEPGTIHKVMHTVAHAKKEIELRKQAAKKAAATAATLSSQDGSGQGKEEDEEVLKSQEEAEKEAAGLVSSAVGAVKETAADIQEFLSRLKYLIDQGAIEGGLSAHLPSPSASSGDPEAGIGGIWVHSGFLSAYDSVRGAVLGIIDTAMANSSSASQESKVIASVDALLEETRETLSHQSGQHYQHQRSSTVESDNVDDEEDESWTVLFTGHSLGGALATLAAFDLSHRTSSWSNKPEKLKIVMYNFGSPRVGNRAFASEFNRVVPHAWRLVNRNDAVVTVPRLVGYCHVGHAVIVGLDPETHNKKIEVQLHSSEAPFEGMAVVDEVLPAVGAVITDAVTRAVPAVIKGVGLEIAAAAEEAAAAEKEKESNGDGTATEEKENKSKLSADQLAEYWEHEKEAWGALFQGTAISEHMEEFYFKGIEDAVDEWRQQSKEYKHTASTKEREELRDIEDNNGKENQHLQHQNHHSNSNNGSGTADGAGLIH